ncbi:hypothetical protein [Xanthovirga aplysinae]|uniref:hypothetical protein n=1 Tax=Xanthovirga aplysinae TaxID=2529853 RepID=UPI0012BC1CFA|nr:hypothetical protein [Xanthovirga aplysinae]MTI30421.1 hypothetical protein [Xanthovirga aplysinae]
MVRFSILHNNQRTNLKVTEETPSIERAFWCDTKEKPIKSAKVYNKVKLIIETKNIADGTEINLLLKDYNFFYRDTTLEERTHKLIVNQNRAVLDLEIPDSWHPIIDKEEMALEVYAKLECNIHGIQIEEEVPFKRENYLSVFSNHENDILLAPDNRYAYNHAENLIMVYTGILDGKAVTVFAAGARRTNAESSKPDINRGLQPDGQRDIIGSVYFVYISGDGDILKTEYHEKTYNQQSDSQTPELTKDVKGKLDVKGGKIVLNNGEIKELSSNLKKDIMGIATFNALNDLDFPRALAEDVKNGGSLALATLGLVNTPLGITTYAIGLVLPSNLEIARNGFWIERSYMTKGGEAVVVERKRGAVEYGKEK